MPMYIKKSIAHKIIKIPLVRLYDPVYQIDDTHSIWVHEGCFKGLNADGNRLLEPIRISGFARHPREYFNLIVGKIKE
jgi:hypothetical protein